MKRIITPPSLRGGFLSATASVRRFTGIAVILAALLVLVPRAATAQIGLIDTFVSGPTEACVNQSITYAPGPDACNSVFWKIVYNDTQLALAATKIECDDPATTSKVEYYYAYTVYASDLAEVTLQPFNAGRCGGLNISTGSLQVKFKQKGKYKIETEPYGAKYGNPSLCQNASKTVYVGLQTVGTITGRTSIGCNSANQVTYSIPPVPGASRYEWSLSNTAMQFTNPVLSNGGASITYTINPTSGATSGTTLSVNVYSICAGEAAVTRTLTLYRSNVTATVTQGLPPVVCRGSRYELRASNGNNYRWVVSYYGSNTGVLQTSTFNGSPVSVTIPFDSRIISLTYTLYYNNVCNGQAAQIGNGAGVSSSGCTSGARLAVAQEEPAAGAHPNPVSDLLTVHVPEAERDGGFTAQLHDGLQRVALTGNTKSSTLRMDVRRLPPGMYLLRTVRASGLVTTKKVLVMH